MANSRRARSPFKTWRFLPTDEAFPPPGRHAVLGDRMETRADETDPVRLAELGDPEFFRHWATLRQRIALDGKSAPSGLQREYAAVSAEYRRRVTGERSQLANSKSRAARAPQQSLSRPAP